MTAIPLGRARRTALVGAMCAGLAAGLTGLTGCGKEDPDAGTNGVGKLSAKKIQSQASAAAKAADSVQVSADLVVKGEPYRIKMRLNGEGGTGEITDSGVTFRLLRIGEDVYMQADAAQLEEGGGKDKLSAKYVKVAPGDPKYKRFVSYTDKDELLGMLLDLHGKVTKEGRDKVGDTRTVQLAASNGSGGTLDVSLEGKPYPLRLVRAGNAGSLTLTDWGKSVPLVPPAKDEMADLEVSKQG
ncbi:hypothetical protein P8605_26545 [Streptomyces sp. T-3]|nr:hypothetical protein [Streptomyces sp. T-3]